MVNKVRVFDTEADGLLDTITKIYVLSFTEDGEIFHTTSDYEVMKEWLSEEEVLWVGHFAIGYDMPAIKAVLGLEMTYKQFWDSMYLSWALFPERPKHGLEALGLEHGFPKVVVREDQWEEGDPVLMRERVERDVLINYHEYLKQRKRLEEIYGT